MAFFVGISPTSKGFAIGKKIRYDRGNKRLVEERELIQVAAWKGYRKQLKNCPYESGSSRSDMKELLRWQRRQSARGQISGI